LIISTIFFF